MRDKSGWKLIPGDFIIYGTLLGRSAGLRYGVVLKINDSDSASVRGVCDSYRAPELLKRGTVHFEDRVLRIRNDQMPKEVLKLLTDAWDEFMGSPQ